jgi:glutathione S-transferase
MITLHAFPPSPRSFKVLAVAEHLGLDHRVRIVDLRAGEQSAPEFATLNPNRRTPVLEDGDFVLWESNAILEYLGSRDPARRLLPAETRAHCDVMRWLCWDLAHWDAACAALIFERVVKQARALGDPDSARVEAGHEQFQRAAAVLDAQLARHPFVTGDALSIADFALGAPLNLAAPAGLPVGDYPAIAHWHGALCELPAWRKHLAASAERASREPGAAV